MRRRLRAPQAASARLPASASGRRRRAWRWMRVRGGAGGGGGLWPLLRQATCLELLSKQAIQRGPPPPPAL